MPCRRDSLGGESEQGHEQETEQERLETHHEQYCRISGRGHVDLDGDGTFREYDLRAILDADEQDGIPVDRSLGLSDVFGDGTADYTPRWSYLLGAYRQLGLLD